MNALRYIPKSLHDKLAPDSIGMNLLKGEGKWLQI
jgi:hypothetical protein